jgi:cytochrome d ubiquinol oxidase subunit II
MFLARVLGILYVMNNVADEGIRARGRRLLLTNAVPFVILFVAFVCRVLLKDGYAVAADGTIYMEPYKYLHNFLDMWYLLVFFLIGVVLVLYGIATEVLRGSKYFSEHASLFPLSGIWPAGIGVVLVVLTLLLCSAWNHTAYYPSTADLQSSLTIANSCSSEFTLRTMAYVSVLIPFVLAYIAYAWYAMDKKKLDKTEIAGGHGY